MGSLTGQRGRNTGISLSHCELIFSQRTVYLKINWYKGISLLNPPNILPYATVEKCSRSLVHAKSVYFSVKQRFLRYEY